MSPFQGFRREKYTKKASLHDISSTLNIRICIDNVFIQKSVVLYVMDSSTRLSLGAVV